MADYGFRNYEAQMRCLTLHRNVSVLGQIKVGTVPYLGDPEMTTSFQQQDIKRKELAIFFSLHRLFSGLNDYLFSGLIKSFEPPSEIGRAHV